jgi:hypothetical protein
MTIKCSKLAKNAFLGPPNCTQIGIFGMKLCHVAKLLVRYDLANFSSKELHKIDREGKEGERDSMNSRVKGLKVY